jgi:hypothetical protein
MTASDLLPSPWTLTQKVGFRFIFLLFGLYILFENNGAFPFFDGLIMHYPTALLHQFIPWVGKHILHLSYPITVFTNGSGDTTYDYVIVFCIFSFSCLGTLIWSLFDSKRADYSTLYYWLTVGVRFYIALMLINYGLYKVFKLQFPSPGPYRLSQTYGHSTPMGLAWTYLGFSFGYNLFMGLAELAAVLLLFRRTMTVGAIITLMTTANVMAVNYFYDVPVKLLSTALVLMTIFLLSHDALRLFKFFFSGQPVSLPVITSPALKNKILKVGKYVLKFGLIGYTLLYGGYQAFSSMKVYGDSSPKPPLYGVYKTDCFVIGQDTLPPNLTDSIRWRQLTMEWPGYSMVQFMNDSTSGYKVKVDTTLLKLDLKNYSDSTLLYSFHYQIIDPAHLQLTGLKGRDSIFISLTNMMEEPKNIRLISGGFHWINEYPNNR